MRRLLFAIATALIAATASAQGTYPERPIRFVIPYPPGGTSDNLGRLLAEKLRVALGQPLVADNKPGGTSMLGAEAVAQAKPDGYTLLLGPSTAFSVLPHLRSRRPRLSPCAGRPHRRAYRGPSRTSTPRSWHLHRLRPQQAQRPDQRRHPTPR